MRPASVLRSVGVAGIAVTAAISVAALPASAAAQTVASPAGTPFDLGPSPVALPSSCAFPNADFNFVFGSGSAVFHDTANANGDWGGETLQGPAVLYDGTTAIAAGHLTVWMGGGNNARGQNEGGLTLSYTGMGPDGSVQIHVNGHSTVNALGQPTSNVLNVHVACS